MSDLWGSAWINAKGGRIRRWRRRGRSGQTLPIFALSIVAVGGMVGVVVDGTVAQAHQRNDQAVADAAALAAAYNLTQSGSTEDTATAAAEKVALFDGCSSSCSIGTPLYLKSDGTQTAAVVNVDHVQINISDSSAKTFSNLVSRGGSRVALAVTASASVPSGGGGPITFVQETPFVLFDSGGLVNLTMTLPAASTAGDLLVATIKSDGTGYTVAPANWIKVADVQTSVNGMRAETWYLPGGKDPGGLTTFTFSDPAGTCVSGAVTEWSGADPIAPLDSVATATATASGPTTTITTSAPTVAAGEVALADYAVTLNGGGDPTYARTVGWTQIGQDPSSGNWGHSAADYITGVGPASVSETETDTIPGHGPRLSWADIITTFKPAGGGGSGSIQLVK